MNTVKQRMSPLTALFLGLFGVVGLGVASGTVIVAYGMRVVDQSSEGIVGIVKSAVKGLPDFLDALPDAATELLADRRAPEYLQNLDVKAKFVVDSRSGAARPTLTIHNRGETMVSLLAVRVAALNDDGIPMGEWTEVVATPLAIDGNWRGPLMPHGTRHVLLSPWRRGLSGVSVEEIQAVVEVSDVRVWEGKQARVQTASAMP